MSGPGGGGFGGSRKRGFPGQFRAVVLSFWRALSAHPGCFALKLPETAPEIKALRRPPLLAALRPRTDTESWAAFAQCDVPACAKAVG